MLPTLERTYLVIDRFADITARILAPLLAIMLLATFAVVVMRYGLDLGTQAVQEVVIYLHATVFMLGFAYTLKAGGHVRVDIFFQKLGVRQQALVNLIGTLFLLFPMCGFILYSSIDYVAFSWRLQEGSPEPGGLPFVYLMKTLIPISACLLLLQGLAELLRNLFIVLEKHDG